MLIAISHPAPYWAWLWLDPISPVTTVLRLVQVHMLVWPPTFGLYLCLRRQPLTPPNLWNSIKETFGLTPRQEKKEDGASAQSQQDVESRLGSNVSLSAAPTATHGFV